MSLGIIGGTGIAAIEGMFEKSEFREIGTPFGAAQVVEVRIKDGSMFFVPRHGAPSVAPPHGVNYRANIHALKGLGVTAVFAAAAVGSCKRSLAPGDLVLIDQFIDFTHGRASTFYDTEIRHTDMTEPYDRALRRLLERAADEKGARIKDGGTYICTQGPRFETPAEIRFFEQIGGDVVGMTGVPEVVLANELDLPYAALAVVTNYAAGMAGHPLAQEEVVEEMRHREQLVFDIFMRAAEIGELL